MTEWLFVVVILAVVAGAAAFVYMRRPSRAVMPTEVTSELIVPNSAPVLAVLDFETTPGRVLVRSGEVVIGRHSDDDIRINDVRVSRHHARLVTHGDGRFEIHNQTSTRSEPNPMLINGNEKEHAYLADGDVVTLGGVNFAFRKAA